jgi:L-amino acid N-acyltransferase YncA
MSDKQEILIISNSKYKITDIYHKPVQTRLTQYNVKVISLELMEDNIQNGRVLII